MGRIGKLKRLKQFLLGVAAGLCWTLPAVAQSVTPTSGTGNVGTQVSGTGAFTVTGGTQQLNTLFHSFEDFSPETANVLFQLDGGQSAVEYVIGRVTGNNLSFIDGQLSLTGGNNPDLFLINPNGITFGSNASLDLPGSFVSSTAASVLFDNKLELSASNPGAAPLLTVSAPVGLQMGANSSDIQVNNTGHDLTAGFLSPVSVGVTPAGLAVKANNTLALVGDNITLDGGILSAADGQTLLGAVAGNNTISLSPSASGRANASKF